MRKSAASLMLCLSSAVLLITTIAGAAERPEMRPPRDVAGAENHPDVVYLPDRVTNTWEDRWLRMNIHVPKGDGPFPCVVFIHGGGWGAGDKDGSLYNAGGPPGDMVARAVAEGYVAVNLNYILSNGGSSKPQVFWDHRAAIRFLRENAARYRIDPGRIAAWGFSAGGWLASSASFSDADDPYEQLAASSAKGPNDLKSKTLRLLVPLDDPRPEYGERSSRLSCVVADFWQMPNLLRPHAPALLTYVGEGATHKSAETVAQAGGRFTQLVLLGDKVKGKNSVHVPSPATEARPLDGGAGKSTLADEVFKWLRRELVTDPVSIPPEARPNRRFFADKVSVTLVAPAPDAEVHYTLDGSEPTASSPVYKAPIALAATTTVRAITVRKGERPSPAIAATFTKADVPEITAPEAVLLPTAKVGRPYEQRFAADGPCVWNLAGHMEPHKPRGGSNELVASTGLTLDPETGVLSGTPTAAGVFTFQVQAARKLGEPADARTYVLKIEE